MVGRCPWILSLSLVLAGGCGKKNAEPTTSPDASASASDETTVAEESPDGAQTEDDPGDTAAEGDADGSRRALLKLKLQRRGKTVEHPGYMVERGEEVTISITQGGRTHEIDFLYDVAEDGYDVQVIYRDNGRKVLQKNTTADKQQWLELKSGDGKTRVSVFLDPDAGRADEMELVGDDDPLGGVQ